jgi:hypothetical protein
MDHDIVTAEPDAEKVGAGRPHPARQPPHPTSLGGIDGVDRVGGSSDRPHLHHDPGPTIECEQIQLSPSHLDVSVQDTETVIL